MTHKNSRKRIHKHTDIDECAEETSQCSQECSNTIGSFICSCVDGYTLDIDGRKCNGRIQEHNVINIIFSLLLRGFIQAKNIIIV